ncbi:MAG: hypothetical protein JNL70_13280 [Saprospiraceae bacterium]|nr:hypothetical protein [Saprospiraceae bacterium]
MSQQRYAIDISRAYHYDFEGEAPCIETPQCTSRTYAFQTDEGHRYIFLAEVFDDTPLVAVKFYRASDAESNDKYHVLTCHRNPFRFFSTIVALMYHEIICGLPSYAFIFKGEPTFKELTVGTKTTKRCTFYVRLLADFVNSSVYEVYEYSSESTMLYMNQKLEQKDMDDITCLLKSYGYRC